MKNKKDKMPSGYWKENSRMIDIDFKQEDYRWKKSKVVKSIC